MILWRDPLLLWLFVGVAAFAVGGVFALRGYRAKLEVFADANLLARIAPSATTNRRRTRLFLRTVILALAVLALAGPKWGFHWEQVHREGIDLIVAIDTSRSMLATDVKPNRLERAKLAVLDLVKLLNGDRIGLVAFAGTAFLECPLTLDYAAFEQTLRAIHVGIIPRGGTAIGRAVETSLAAFEAKEGKHEALILITDGEDHEGNVEEIAKQAVERGIKVYTVGIGTTEGELLPATGKQGSQGYVKDRQGQVVKSRLNEEVLQTLAMTTSGAYVRGLGPALGLDEVFRDHIAKMERREVASTLERRYEDRFQIPLLAALLLLLIESFVSDQSRADARPRRRLFRRNSAIAPVLVLALSYPLLVGWFDPPRDRAAEGNKLLAVGKTAEAAEKFKEGLVDSPASPLLLFNLGVAQYKLGQFAEAAVSFEKVLAGGDPQHAAKASYSLANARYRVGAAAEASEPKTAVSSYQQSLALYRRAMGADPAYEEPKIGHEFVQQKLAALEKRLKEEQEKQQQEQQDQPEQGEQEKQEQKPEEGAEQEQQEQQDEQKPEEQGDEQQQGDQPPSDQPGEERKQEEQQAGSEGEDAPKEEAQPEPKEDGAGQAAEDQPPPSDQPSEQGEGGTATAGEENASPDQKAAQAILDTARSEELGPDDVKRKVGVVGVGEPAQDW